MPLAALRRALAGTTALLALLLLAAPAAAVDVGGPAPVFSLPTADGQPIVLDKLRGQVVYVDFWASWCGPCRRSFPWMNELQQRYGDRGFTIVAINVDKQRADAERFLQANVARFTVVYDPEGTTPLAYAVAGMPSSYLIDRRGSVVEIEAGFRDERKAAREATSNGPIARSSCQSAAWRSTSAASARNTRPTGWRRCARTAVLRTRWSISAAMYA